FNYIDHDDQILLTCEVLKKETNALENEQRKTRYLLVDEYQDINYAQWELIQLLSRANTKNLFVVGDKYQSIYGFRGGSPEYIENFERDYASKAVSCKLTRSFRCPPNIFKGAYHLVQRYNGGHLDFADKIDYEEKSNIPIKICEFEYGNQEAAFLARKVKDIGPSYDSLILIPTLNYANPIRSALRKMFVDFSCNYNVEDTDMYIICSLIEWLKETSNNFSFRLFIDKIISKKFRPKEKQAILQKISNFWQEVVYRKTLYQRIKTLINDEQFKKLPVAIAKIRKIWKDSEETVSFVVGVIEELQVWNKLSYFSNELISIKEEIRSIETSGGSPNVRILTMKKAKGLEADYVFIVGLENNILPRKNANKDEKAEDSRLLYVSMTRAKKALYLLYCNARERKISKFKTLGRSEFIDAIPIEYRSEGE
ncbi:ATP-dependent helicase, partial [candidate division WOR-3 bacterium]|nr:ATP-dependent helicase [candidate division WOR-3 bacterium]